MNGTPEGNDAPERIAGYYRLLFTFPSRTAMSAAIVAMSIIAGLIAYAFEGLLGPVEALMFSLIGLVLPLFVSDIVLISVFEGDPVLRPRRFTIMTFVVSVVFSSFIVLSSVAGFFLESNFLLRGIVVAGGLAAGLRLLSLRVFIPEGVTRAYAAALLQPLLCLASMATLIRGELLTTLLAFVSVLVYAAGVELLLSVLGRWEGGEVGLVRLFRAFALSWMESINTPLEEEITRMGEAMDLGIDALYFTDDAGGCIGALVVPYIHPGPYGNVGSSALTSILDREMREALGCDVLVAHGVSTHERDLTDSGENRRVVEAILGDYRGGATSHLVSPMVWAERGGANASCQLFGDVALITLTLSPLSYDDLPETIKDVITDLSGELGLEVIVVDSHNSIDLEGGLEEYDASAVVEVAREAIKRAQSEPKYSFKVGVSRIVPDEWGLEDGMGSAGITALAIELEGGRRNAYVVVDGNNMAAGLRERIVPAVERLGLDAVEVMTSDTHEVNAIGATDWGYFPIGERTDGQKIMEYSIRAVEGALLRMLPGGASAERTVVPGLTVLGSKGLATLQHVLESGFSLFGRAGLVLGVACFLISAVITLLI